MSKEKRWIIPREGALNVAKWYINERHHSKMLEDMLAIARKKISREILGMDTKEQGVKMDNLLKKTLADFGAIILKELKIEASFQPEYPNSVFIDLVSIDGCHVSKEVILPKLNRTQAAPCV